VWLGASAAAAPMTIRPAPESMKPVLMPTVSMGSCSGTPSTSARASSGNAVSATGYVIGLAGGCATVRSDQ
jgi:hypothetical protein